jgi:hypothetical protein
MVSSLSYLASVLVVLSSSAALAQMGEMAAISEVHGNQMRPFLNNSDAETIVGRVGTNGFFIKTSKNQVTSVNGVITSVNGIPVPNNGTSMRPVVSVPAGCQDLSDKRNCAKEVKDSKSHAECLCLQGVSIVYCDYDNVRAQLGSPLKHSGRSLSCFSNLVLNHFCL